MLGLCSANCDCIGQLGAPLLVFEGYVGKFGGYVGPFGGHVGPCGGHAKTMFSNLWLYWRFLEAMFGHFEAMLGLCSATYASVWRFLEAMFGRLGAMLGHLEAMLVCGGYVGPFGSYIGSMLGHFDVVQ